VKIFNKIRRRRRFNNKLRTTTATNTLEDTPTHRHNSTVSVKDENQRYVPSKYIQSIYKVVTAHMTTSWLWNITCAYVTAARQSQLISRETYDSM